MSQAPLRPRHAATLILIRRDAAAPQVLMGRRVGGHAFMPDKWVFPGGRIHASDYRVAAAREPDAQMLSLTAQACPQGCTRRARALMATAIRETFEETGLILGQPGSGRTRSAEWRDFLGSGHLPDLSALTLIGRAITPPLRTRRFDARFFMADASALVSVDPGSGSGELDEVAWFPLERAMALDLPSITRALLGDVAARVAGARPPVPFHHFRRGQHVLEQIIGGDVDATPLTLEEGA